MSSLMRKINFYLYSNKQSALPDTYSDTANDIVVTDGFVTWRHEGQEVPEGATLIYSLTTHEVLSNEPEEFARRLVFVKKLTELDSTMSTSKALDEATSMLEVIRSSLNFAAGAEMTTFERETREAALQAVTK